MMKEETRQQITEEQKVVNAFYRMVQGREDAHLYPSNFYDRCIAFVTEYGDRRAGEADRQWISVKDRLPEKDGIYHCICEDEPALMMITDGKIRQVRFCNGGVYTADYAPKDYTYWAPKPQTEHE